MTKGDKQLTKVLLFGAAMLGVGILFLLYKIYAIQNPVKVPLPNLDVSKSISLLPIFLTGLITGGLTCLAVQGGLLASTIAQQEENRLLEKGKKFNTITPIIAFLGAKLIAYTILGFLLGLFGSLFQLSL